MGIRLIVEVLDHWQDAGLTAGERWDLLVLAENANDGSRLTFGPVHAQHILDRANKSPKGWKNAITALMRKKVITTHVPGRIGQVAVYHLEHLCPDAPHDGNKGQCTRPPKDQKEGHPMDDPATGEGHLSDAQEGHPAGDPQAQEGHPADAKRVIQEVTPTPLYSSFKDSPLTTPSSSVAEVADSGNVTDVVAAEGGGGGEDSFFEELNKQSERVDAFVAKLPFPGRPPGKKQQLQLRQRLIVAFKAGWSERGLARYLDISDEPNVRSAAALYLHRLDDDNLPDAGEAAAVAAGLPPVGPDCYHDPRAVEDAKYRVDAITGAPCPRCHPTSVAQTATVRLPPPCDSCAKQPGAATNPTVRVDPMSFTGEPCPNCHPSKVPGDWDWPRKPLKGDERVQGWYDLSPQLAAEEAAKAPKPMVASNGYTPFFNPEDESVYDKDFPDPDPFDDNRYEKDL